MLSSTLPARPADAGAETRAAVETPAGLRCHAAAAAEGLRRTAHAADQAWEPAETASRAASTAAGAAAAAAHGTAAVAGNPNEAAACSAVAGEVVAGSVAAAAAAVEGTARVRDQHRAENLPPAAAACRSWAAALRKPAGSWAACTRAAPDMEQRPAAALGLAPMCT